MNFSFLKQINTNSCFILVLAFFIGCTNKSNDNNDENFMDPTKLKIDFSNYDVCECNKEAKLILEQSILIRNNHINFKSFKNDKKSVLLIRSWAKRWSNLMQSCFRKNGASMWASSECNNQVMIQKKKEILYNLGIQIDQGEKVKL
tara:strand:- start:124 stop:561 length:438 start_codon:yes stop_codon:yes gene_type:complete